MRGRQEMRVNGRKCDDKNEVEVMLFENEVTSQGIQAALE